MKLGVSCVLKVHTVISFSGYCANDLEVIQMLSINKAGFILWVSSNRWNTDMAAIKGWPVSCEKTAFIRLLI